MQRSVVQCLGEERMTFNKQTNGSHTQPLTSLFFIALSELAEQLHSEHHNERMGERQRWREIKRKAERDGEREKPTINWRHSVYS